jgi:hypothetical protein
MSVIHGVLIRLYVFIIGCHLFCFSLYSQDTETWKEDIKIHLDIRPRAEFRNNFMLTAADSTMPEIFASQRNRIHLTYQRRKLKFLASAQEIHLWGKQGKLSTTGSINFYELYLEPSLTKNLSLRIGRQGISLDNGRLFSDAPWSQQGRAHEGVRLLYASSRLAADLITTFTRDYSTHFDAAYSPVAAHTYKLLLVQHAKYTWSKHYTFTLINAAEAFERLDKPSGYYIRVTNGGRVEYLTNKLYLTISGYYQYGENATRKKISAYYLQPETSYTINKIRLRLGAEISSGENTAFAHTKSRSFVPLYGVAWKFMGNMNFFTRFPSDVNNSGLINPYLFVVFTLTNKLYLRADGNLFYTQYPLVYPDKSTANRYLGFENDLSFNYKISPTVDMQGGFSYLLPTNSMVLLNKVEDAQKIPVWSYFMISFRPQVFAWTRTHSKLRKDL